MCFRHREFDVLRSIIIIMICSFLVFLQNQFPLHVAATLSFSAEILKILIDAGAEVDAVDEVGYCVVSEVPI